MFQQTLDSLANRSQGGDDKFYEQHLDACVEGIKKFPVTKRLISFGNHFPILPFAAGVVTSPAPVDPAISLPLPPQSPPREPRSSPDGQSPTVAAKMDHSSLHGGPARKNVNLPSIHPFTRLSQDVRSSQDARSNLAVQPAANAGTFKLKKNAVKIVSAAGPSPSLPHLKASLHAVPSTSPTSTSTLPAPASPSAGVAQHASGMENEQPQLLQPSPKPALTSLVAKLSPSKVKLPQKSLSGSLDDMFARLSATSPSLPSSPAKELYRMGPDKSSFSFEACAKTTTAPSKVPAIVTPQDQTESLKTLALPASKRVQDEPARVHIPPEVQVSTLSTRWHGESVNVCEAEYLRKSAEFFHAFPSHPGTASHTIKAAAKNLRAAYIPELTNLRPEEVEKLRARFVFAVINYVNKKVKLNPKPLTADLIKELLLVSDGDFLQLCSVLVKDKYIPLDNLEHIKHLCQHVLDVLPKADVNTTIVAPAKRAASAAAATSTTVKAPEVASEEIQMWPAQEKRKHGAIYRGCVLKGVSGVKSLNQLQALVWGGRLESMSMPATGSEHALVTFLTPEACQAYLNATENGIEIKSGTKSTVVFVERQLGPASINDVIQNCIDRDASRCIRATGADEDWSDEALFVLARGKQQVPRDVDRIKQGKTARGHHYIEFRFGNIYHALNFKRYLISDEEWEACSIGYAPDPCELARGVHCKDADEEESGFLPNS
ncbi:hypothetical protein SVAN01_08978 [Stagonosporopsis vannaccii]|nr:hypothetical protein SVAN01_08978 [Stagonosporopsis vannaccii]